MPLYKTSRDLLDRNDAIELVLELDSFAGGENTIGTDQELKKNEARVIKNWDINSIGGMVRNKGMSLVIDGGVTYTGKIDLAIQHVEGSSTSSFYISGGKLLKKSGSSFVLDVAGDATVFTSGVLSHAVTSNNKLWITNTTDNLKVKTIGVAVAAPAGVPSSACERIYEHPTSRLIAEGGGLNVYGSRTGSGNWTSADAWSATNDAFSMTFPEYTKGAVMGFPSGNDLTVFTEHDTYIVYNIPSVYRRKVINGIGSHSGYAVARGSEGVFFFSLYPTKGIFLWDGNQFTDLTQYHSFKDDIHLTNRCFGAYRDHKYYFIYNEINSGVSYPNRCRVYDARHGRWYEREVNSSLADSLGYPCLLARDNNELYFGSSVGGKVYEIDDSTTSDAGQNTVATYQTKYFSSQDFLVKGSQFPVDNVRMKLVKSTVELYGTTGILSILWSGDKNRNSGSQTYDLSASGDYINTTFTVNSSSVITNPLTKIVTKTFSNSAIGRNIAFQINNSGSGTRPEIRKIRIYAIALEDF